MVIVLLWIILGLLLMNFAVACLAYTLLSEFRQFLEFWMRLRNGGASGEEIGG